MLRITVFILLFISSTITYGKDFNSTVKQNAKNSTVSIEVRNFLSAYERKSAWLGTGFLIDKENGIIATNAHITGKGIIAYYELTFFAGKKVEAQFLYADPWQDFAFLKVNPKELPPETVSLPVNTKEVPLDEEVLVSGNNEGFGFSILTGTITDLYQSAGFFPNRSYQISLNAQGGSSGSPVVNAKGDVIALIYGGSEATALALPIAYVQDALKQLQKNKTPSRKHNGALLVPYSLDDATKFFGLPEDFTQNYVKKFPHARNLTLRVVDIFYTPHTLQHGDIILEIDGQAIGPDIYLYDKVMNNHPCDTISLKIFRNKEFITVTTTLRDLQEKSINKMLKFEGGVFYEFDDLIKKNFLEEENPHKVMLSITEPGSSFTPLTENRLVINNTPVVFTAIEALNGQEIFSLEDLERVIKQDIDKRYWKIKAKDHSATIGFSRTPMTTKRSFLVDILRNKLEKHLNVYAFEPQTLSWATHYR